MKNGEKKSLRNMTIFSPYSLQFEVPGTFSYFQNFIVIIIIITVVGVIIIIIKKWNLLSFEK